MLDLLEKAVTEESNGLKAQSEPGAEKTPHNSILTVDTKGEIIRTCALLMTPGDVHEVRVPKTADRGTISGYFDKAEEIADAVLAIDGTVPGVYISLNPVSHTATHRLTEHAKTTAKDRDIIHRRWLMIDFDPDRPAGISATESEHLRAISAAMQAREYLQGRGFPDPVMTDSGNGAHLLYRLDMPNDASSTKFVKGVLAEVKAHCTVEGVSVDQAVFNAARITKLYGTLACKGQKTAERPHRRSGLLEVPETLTAVKPAADRRAPIDRLMQMAIAKISDEGRNNAGVFFFCQLRDNRYTAGEARTVLPKWVQIANDAAPKYGEDRYTQAEAEASLKSAYGRAPREPSTEPGTGLVQEIEKALEAEGHHFARDEGDILYHFEEGVYKPTGEKFVRRAVKGYCEANGKASKWTPELADRVVKYIAVDAPELWERPPLDTLNVRNGLLDVKTRELRPRSADFLSPIQIGASFDAAAKCPAIDHVFPDDAHHAAFEVAAWLMLPDVSIQKAVLCIGEGANGKSVLLSLLEAFIGKRNATALTLHKIESDKFAAARLMGKLANICPDLPTAALSGTSTFKALTGGDSISGEYKFKMSFEFRPYARLIFSANSAPRSDDATHGFFRRWLILPFNNRFDESDPRSVPRAVLDARLTTPEELSGLLNRALDALPQIQRGRFTESDSMRAAWTEFRRTTDPLAVFLDSNTVDAPDGLIPKERLRALYASDCKDNGRPIPAENVFTERLRAIRPNVKTAQRRIDGKPRWCFVGIGMRAAEYETDGQQGIEF